MRNLLIALALAGGTHAQAAPFAAAARVDDAGLAALRGGFTVAGGVEVSLAVQMDAAVNGALVLRSVFRVTGDTPTLTVFAPPPGATGPSWSAPPRSGTTAGDGQAPLLVLTGQNGISRVQPAVAVPTSVAVSSTGNPAIGAAPAGLAPLAVTVGGPAVATADGQLRLVAVPQGTSIQLEGVQLAVNQIVGAAFQNLVANSGNNRTIDTATTLNIDLRNTQATAAAVGAARVADVVSNLALRMVR